VQGVNLDGAASAMRLVELFARYQGAMAPARARFAERCDAVLERATWSTDAALRFLLEHGRRPRSSEAGGDPWAHLAAILERGRTIGPLLVDLHAGLAAQVVGPLGAWPDAGKELVAAGTAELDREGERLLACVRRR